MASSKCSNDDYLFKMMITCKQEDDDLAKLRWELLSLHQTLVLAISLVRVIYANNILETFQLYIE